MPWQPQKFFSLGTFLFSVAMLFFGIQQLFSMFWVTGPTAGPPWISHGPFWAPIFGILLGIGAIGIALKFRADIAAGIIALVLFLRAAVLFLPGMLTTPHNPGNWTSGWELFGMAGASFVLMATCSKSRGAVTRSAHAERFGEILFAGMLVVVGVQHFIYAQFTATIVPAWIPVRLFWAYFVGIVFFAAALSIFLRKAFGLATFLLGATFFTFFLIVHIPRVLAAPRSGVEWTSAFVALSMSGGALILGLASTNRLRTPAF